MSDHVWAINGFRVSAETMCRHLMVELTRRDEQIAEARRLADRHEDRCGTAIHAWSCDCRFGDIRAVLNRGAS